MFGQRNADSSRHGADTTACEHEEGVRGHVLRLILYFDLFQHPLRLSELVRLITPGDERPVLAAVEGLRQEGLVAGAPPWVHRPGQEGLVVRRAERERAAERLWPSARRAAALLSRLPYVRGLLVTGSLSKNSVDPDGDVDFMVLVEPGRVWTLKTLLQAGRRVLPDPARELFCTNYLLDTAHSRIDDRNLYTAIELATAVPIYGRDAVVALMRENAWAARFVPGWSWVEERARHTAPAPAHWPRLEWAVPSVAQAPVERASLRAWDAFWERKYAYLHADDRKQRFKRRPELATNMLHDFQFKVLHEMGERLAAVGLHAPLWMPGEGP